jgi:hypothetical protein
MRTLPRIEPMYCLYCNDRIRGRSDKKFCDDNCRASFNSALNGRTHPYICYINREIRRNRRILRERFDTYTPETPVEKEWLIAKGFNFFYATHREETETGIVMVYCYEYGYILLPNNKVQLLYEPNPYVPKQTKKPA